MNIFDFENAIYLTISAIAKKSKGAEVPILWARMNNKRPAQCFVTLDLLGGQNAGSGWRDAGTTADGKRRTGNDYEDIARIQAIGAGGRQLVQDIADWVNLAEFAAILNNGGVCVVRCGRAQNISGLIGTVYEERATVDITFRTGTVTIESGIGYIDSVRIGGKITLTNGTGKETSFNIFKT